MKQEAVRQFIHIETQNRPAFCSPRVSDMAGAEYVFPSECPSCRVNQGMPYKAATMETGATSVSLRCRCCRHEWDLKMPNGNVSFAPKSDRRRQRREN